MGCSNSKGPIDDKTNKTIPISYKELMNNFNDKNFINMIVEEGIKEFRTGIDEMVLISNKTKDLKELKLYAHSMKGSAVNITCYNMADLANKVENISSDSKNFTKDSIQVKHILDDMIVELHKIQVIFQYNS